MRYKIIKAWSHDYLENRVGYMLSKGWELQGGVSVTVIEYGVQYAQAMVKHDKVDMNIRAPKTSSGVKFIKYVKDYIK